MKCPHCSTGIHASWSRLLFTNTPDSEHSVDVLALKTEHDEDDDRVFRMHWMKCPDCDKLILDLTLEHEASGKILEYAIVWPEGGAARAPLPPEVPNPYAKDYGEAARILNASPRASAALSRRNLQTLLHKVEKIERRTLADEIQALLDSKKLPSYVTDLIDAIREVGNFGAHPIENEHTGDIIEVEPHEAELLLDILDELFDFYFVGPAKAKLKRDAINAKLDAAGKKPLKK